jgi:aminopeptidase N
LSRLLCRIVAVSSLLLPAITAHALPAEHAQPPRNFDLLRVSAELRVDWQTERVYGQARLELQAFKPGALVELDAAALQIALVTDASGRRLQHTLASDRSQGALQIRLPEPVAAGTKVTLKIVYHSTHHNRSDANALAGSNGKGLRFLQPSLTEPRRHRQLWAASENGGVRNWLPGIDQSNERAQVELTFLLPEAYSAAAVGELSAVPSSGAERRWHYLLDEPQPLSRIAFAIGEYKLLEQRVQIDKRSVTLRHFAYPDEEQATRDSVEQMPNMLKFFGDYTGIPYWRNSYQQAMVQDLPWGIFAPNFSVQTENMVDDWTTHDEYQFLWDHLAAEGLAWQWSGGLVSPREPRDEWLVRSLNRFLDSKWDQHRRQTDAEYVLWPNTWDFGTYFTDWSANVRMPAVTRAYASADELLTSNAPLTRGTLVLRLLEDHLGAETFQRTVRLFLQRHRGKLVSTEDFFAAAEEVSGESLRWFQRQWLEGVGHPELKLEYRQEGESLVIGITQSTASTPREAGNAEAVPTYPQAEFFQGWITLEMDGRTERLWLAPQAMNRYTLRQSAPKYVYLDPQRVWMLTLERAQDVASLRAQISITRYAHSRNFAIGELIKLAQADPALRDATVDLILKTAENTQLYWRERFAALWQLTAWLGPVAQVEASRLSADTVRRLTQLIANEQKWIKAQAILLLGATQDPAYAALYIELLKDRYDRVVNAAAFALGRSKSPLAFDALIALPQRPSWKQQSLISALNGLRVLQDPRAETLALEALTERDVPRWTLATPVWDFRFTAAQTLAAIDAGASALPVLERRFNDALKHRNVLDAFNTITLASMLRLRQAEPWLKPLRAAFADDASATTAIDQLQAQFDALKTGGAQP